MGRIFVREIPTIPDCEHHRLVTLCGGNVRERIFKAFEHLLRMVANFEEGKLALGIRFAHDPNTDAGLRERLRLQIALRVGEGISDQIVAQLIDTGPLCEFYQRRCARPGCGASAPLSATSCSVCGSSFNADGRDQFDLEEFPHICEVVRREDRVEAQVPREQNRYVPSSGFYCSPVPFEAQQENDHLLLDALLSRVEQRCVVEFLVAPVDQTHDIQAHDKYIRRLMAVNQYGDDVYLGQESQSAAAGPWVDEPGLQRTIVEQAKKRDPIADEVLREQQDFHRSLRQPQLLFHLKAFAMSPENSLMLASTFAESGISGGKYQLISHGLDTQDDGDEWLAASHRDSRAMSVSLHAKSPKVWRGDLPSGWQGLARLSHLATVDELRGVIRLPVGGHGSPRCIRKATDPPPAPVDDTVLIGDDLESEDPPERIFGDDLSETFDCVRPSRPELRLPLRALTKHMFIAGVPGSGKTTAVFNLLVQLSRQGVPFLVIEPAKTEYRILKTLRSHPDPAVREMASDMRMFTPGNETVSPLRFNPLAHPEGVTLDEHIGQVLACFEAAMPMGGPLQALIAEAVEEVYEGENGHGFPMMTDLLSAAQRIMEAKRYEGEVKSNLQAAIEVRLGLLTRRAMGRVFQSETCIPSVAELLAHPTVIEMDYLSQEHACLLTLFLLSAVREQIRVDAQRRAPGLHHVTVIEEAHNIVGRTGAAKASEEIADPKAFAAQYVARMLAEMRALGEGIVIADQLPSAVAPEVVKNTGTKLAHRLVSNEDREDLGGAMLLGPSEIEEIARLSPGEAYLYTEGLHRPRRVRVLNANDYLRLGESPTGALIVSHLSGDEWFIRGREERALRALLIVQRQFRGLMEKVAETNALFRPGGLIPDQLNLANATEDSHERAERLREIIGALVDAREELVQVINGQFEGKILRPLMPVIQAALEDSSAVRELSERVEEEYDTQIGTPYAELVRSLDDAEDKARNLL